MRKIASPQHDPLAQPCDIWPHGSRTATGQALHTWREDGKRHTKLAGRIFWEIATGQKLGPKQVINMLCGEPMCVFVGHMVLETRQAIAERRMQKQALPDCPASVAKLPLETRIMLTICVANDIGTTTKLARRFGVTPYQVRTIRDFVRKQDAQRERDDARRAGRDTDV